MSRAYNSDDGKPSHTHKNCLEQLYLMLTTCAKLQCKWLKTKKKYNNGSSLHRILATDK